MWNVHTLNQLADHGEEAVDLLRPVLADLSLGLDDVAAAVGVPGIDINAPETTPGDRDIEAERDEVRAGCLIYLVFGNPISAAPYKYKWPGVSAPSTTTAPGATLTDTPSTS